MQNFANYFAEFTNGAIALRLLLAAVLGCVIGLERATKHHPAGMRTFALVCIGAAASAVVNIYLGTALASEGQIWDVFPPAWSAVSVSWGWEPSLLPGKIRSED